MAEQASLSGVRMRLDRARKHLADLESACNSFMRDDAKTRGGVDIELDPNAGLFLSVAHVPAAFPEELGGIAGEILYHLRSALDNLIWQLVLANEKTPGSWNEFPVYTSETHFDGSSPGQLKGISDTARATVKGLQPFSESSENPKHATLYLIHDLNRIDKHRLPHMTRLWLCHLNAVFNSPKAGGPVRCTYTAPIGPLEDQAKLCEFRFNPDQMRPFNENGEVYVDLDVSSDIALQNPEMGFLPLDVKAGDSLPLRPFFKLALSYMEDIVIPRLSSELN